MYRWCSRLCRFLCGKALPSVHSTPEELARLSLAKRFNPRYSERRSLSAWEAAKPPHSLLVTVFNSTTQNDSNTTATHLELGSRGEELAAAYLINLGYRLVAANFEIPVGRNRNEALVVMELDLVAYDREVLCFVEVKTRASDWFAPPQVNVDRRKQRQIARAARAYRRMFDLMGEPYRYDVVTVVLPADDAEQRGPRVELLRSYWSERDLRKRFWREEFYY